VQQVKYEFLAYIKDSIRASAMVCRISDNPSASCSRRTLSAEGDPGSTTIADVSRARTVQAYFIDI